MYDSLLQTPSHGGHRLSWSSFDNDAYSTWSSPQAYSMPTAIASQSSHQSSAASMPQYAYTQPPPPLGSNVPPSSWDQSTSYMHQRSPLHTGAPTSPSVYGYNSYPVAQQPMMPHSPVYTASTGRAAYATMPHAAPPTTSSQQGYDPTASAMYRDPRNSHHPYYHS